MTVRRGRIWRWLFVAAATAGWMALSIAPPDAAGRVPAYHSPGYAGMRKLPRVAPVPPVPPVTLSRDGADPHVLVDAAGSAHVAWSVNPGGQASVLEYCRLPRGGTACTGTYSDVPQQPDQPGNSPAINNDDWGPFPLAVGNELLLLDARCCNTAPTPGGGTTDSPVYLFASEAGGDTGSFTGPSDPNSSAGTVGDLPPSGNAIVFNGNSPYLGIISDAKTGGTFFQGVPTGQYTGAQANLSLDPSQAYDGRLALDGSRPIAAFDDTSGHTIVREWNGEGDVNDPGNWSVLQISGAYAPRIVGGPAGVYLITSPSLLSGGALQVRRIAAGGVAAGPPVTLAGANTAFPAASEDTTSGRIAVAWVDRNSNPSRPAVHVRTSADGVHFSPDQVVSQIPGGELQGLSVAATSDGGGFVAFSDTAGTSSSFHGKIDAAQFGPITPTGHPGLGLKSGGSGPPAGDQKAYASCTQVHFGAIDALAESGCFLRDPSHPSSGAAVTEGEIRLNGLEIIPDPGAKIAIDPRQHTINTFGAVSVNLRAPGIGDITLWHGSLNVSLPGGQAGAGQTLFDFDTSKFAAVLQGFPIDASIEVQLEHDAVRIPISLKLPAYMGGVSGSATLLADNAHGLDLQSLHIGVDDLELGALEIKNLSIDYTESGNVWKGGATLYIPGGTPYFGIEVHVEFDNGAFTMGSFYVTLPFPGIPVFTDVYVAGFGGGFDIRPPRKRFFGTVTAGAIPLDPPNYTFSVSGTVSITFTDQGPVILEVDGSGAIHGYTIVNAKLVFQTNGYMEVDGNVMIDLDIAALQGGMNSFIDLPSKQFNAEAKMQLDLFGYGVFTADSVISSKGVAACGSVAAAELGFTYPWGGHADLTGGFGKSCDVSAYTVQSVSHQAVAADRGGRAHEAVASLHVPAHLPFEDILVTGAGAPPSVLLTSPTGHQITPTSASTASSPAVAIPVAKRDQTLVLLRAPAGGNWQLTPAAGSPPIVSVSTASGIATPRVRARVHGHGRRRALSYRVSSRGGLTISFAEQGHGIYHLLGSAGHTRGTLHFKPADGPAGMRQILAIVSTGGLPRQRLVVAHYRAPGPAVPGRVRGLRAVQQGGHFRISFGQAANAARYFLRIDLSDGRHLRMVIGSRRHSLTLPVRGYRDQITVSVAGVSATGRLGRTVRAHAAWISRVARCATRRHRHRGGCR